MNNFSICQYLLIIYIFVNFNIVEQYSYCTFQFNTFQFMYFQTVKLSKIAMSSIQEVNYEEKLIDGEENLAVGYRRKM